MSKPRYESEFNVCYLLYNSPEIVKIEKKSFHSFLCVLTYPQSPQCTKILKERCILSKRKQKHPSVSVFRAVLRKGRKVREDFKQLPLLRFCAVKCCEKTINRAVVLCRFSRSGVLWAVGVLGALLSGFCSACAVVASGFSLWSLRFRYGGVLRKDN